MDYMYIYIYIFRTCVSLKIATHIIVKSQLLSLAPAISIPKQWNDDPKLGAPVESLSIGDFPN